MLFAFKLIRYIDPLTCQTYSAPTTAKWSALTFFSLSNLKQKSNRDDMLCNNETVKAHDIISKTPTLSKLNVICKYNTQRKHHLLYSLQRERERENKNQEDIKVDENMGMMMVMIKKISLLFLIISVSLVSTSFAGVCHLSLQLYSGRLYSNPCIKQFCHKQKNSLLLLIKFFQILIMFSSPYF